MHIVDLILDPRGGSLLGQVASTYAEHSPVADFISGFVGRLKKHSVGMKRKEYLRFPDNIHLGMRQKCLQNGHIGHVAFAGCRQTAVESHPKRSGVGITAKELLGRAPGAHRVAA